MLDRVQGDAAIVTNVSPEQFVNIEKEREKRVRGFRFRRYDSSAHVLIVTLPTSIHEQLHLVLYMAYYKQLVRRGIDESWESIGATTLPAADNRLGGDGGEGDSTGGPILEREGSDQWPTLVIEAGYSQSLTQLHAVMRWWFDKSRHNVKIVLLAKFDRQQDRIILQRWEEELPPARPGATTTRQALTLLQPVLSQEITIGRDKSTDPPSYNVASGALVLEFRRLFLRDPGEGEGDFIIGIEELQRYARMVWRRV